MTERNLAQKCIYKWWIETDCSSPTNCDWHVVTYKWTASSEFGTYSLCEQRRFRRACASAQSRQNLRCSLIQAVSQEEPSDRKPDPWPLWMAGHAQLKFVMTECSKTQIRLTGLKYEVQCFDCHSEGDLICLQAFRIILYWTLNYYPFASFDSALENIINSMKLLNSQLSVFFLDL